MNKAFKNLFDTEMDLTPGIDDIDPDPICSMCGDPVEGCDCRKIIDEFARGSREQANKTK